MRAKELVCRLRDTDPILKSTGTGPEFNKVLHEGNVQMYRKGISKLLIAGLLLSGIQLPGTTGIAQADNGKDADRLSASTGQADAARGQGSPI